MSHPVCITYGCTYELDLDGQITCIICGSKNDEIDLNTAGYSTGKWSDDDDFGITPFLGPMR
jgi:hypothetical protein